LFRLTARYNAILVRLNSVCLSEKMNDRRSIHEIHEVLALDRIGIRVKKHVPHPVNSLSLEEKQLEK